MARKRMIDPSIWADERFARLSPEAQVMFIGLISNADDEGRLPGNAAYLASSIFPYKGLSIEKATKIRDEVLTTMRSATLYVVDDCEYIQLKKFNTYQNINRPSDSKYPSLTEQSVNDHGELIPNRIEENRKEKNTPLPPKGDDVKEVFSFYQETTGSQELLTPARREKIKLRLKEFGRDKLLQVVRNTFIPTKKNAFYRGENDRKWKANIDYIFRNTEVTDKLLNLGGVQSEKVITDPMVLKAMKDIAEIEGRGAYGT